MVGRISGLFPTTAVIPLRSLRRRSGDPRKEGRPSHSSLRLSWLEGLPLPWKEQHVRLCFTLCVMDGVRWLAACEIACWLPVVPALDSGNPAWLGEPHPGKGTYPRHTSVTICEPILDSHLPTPLEYESPHMWPTSRPCRRHPRIHTHSSPERDRSGICGTRV